MSKKPQIAWTASRNFRVRPCAVTTVTPAGWTALAEQIGTGEIALLDLWPEGAGAQMALYDADKRRIAVVRVKARKGAVPSIGQTVPSAQRLERAAADLSGLVFENAPDARPWVDHGRWDIAHPMGAAGPHPGQQPYEFLPVSGQSLHQVPVGPVHAGVIEPGHFRFTAQGETVVRLEERFGYVHKGIEALLQGADLTRGAELAGRTSGDSTVAYAWAYAQAVESALEVDVPARAFALRGVMAELERLANHLGDIGAVCNDAAFPMMLAQTGALREDVLRTAKAVFGHRYMRDRIVPGGVTTDITAETEPLLWALLDRIRDRFPVLVDLYDTTASLLDRTVSTGHLDPALAAQFGAGGFVGRASGRDFDVRRDLRYAPYDMLRVEVPVRTDGDVNARIWVRINEVDQCLALLHQLFNTLPDGPIQANPEPHGEARSGIGLVEGFRGDILVWVSLDEDGRIDRCRLRDPSCFQWPLLEAAIEGNIIADFPLCNKSFNCSYSGHDL